MSNRGTVVAAAVVGALLVGAAGIGIIYFVLFSGSSPQKLALSSPTPSTSASSASASPASTPAAGTWTAAPLDAIANPVAAGGYSVSVFASGPNGTSGADSVEVVGNNVYVGYSNGYYLYNRMHPGEAMAITVIL